MDVAVLTNFASNIISSNHASYWQTSDVCTTRFTTDLQITDSCRDNCEQTEHRRSAGYERVYPADVETLRLPQRPHDYTSISSTTTQRHDVIVEEDAGDSQQVNVRWIQNTSQFHRYNYEHVASSSLVNKHLNYLLNYSYKHCARNVNNHLKLLMWQLRNT